MKERFTVDITKYHSISEVEIITLYTNNIQEEGKLANNVSQLQTKNIISNYTTAFKNLLISKRHHHFTTTEIYQYNNNKTGYNTEYHMNKNDNIDTTILLNESI